MMSTLPREPPDPPSGASPAAISIVSGELAADVHARVLDGLRAHTRRHTAPPAFEPLTLAAHDGEELIGGLVGETGWEWFHVSLFWVAERHRGRGIGDALLHAAERAAAERGCGAVYLDTFDFQARPFYERRGYRVFGVQEDYPPGSRRFFLEKRLPRTGR